VFAIGVTFKTYTLCVIGRFIFGLGGESLTVAQNAYTARWFEGDEMAMAFGLVVAFSRIGTSVNFLITPFFSKIGVPFSIWFGAEMCLISFCAAIYCGILDWHGDEAAEMIKRKRGDVGEPDVSIKHVLQFPLMSWLVFLNCMFFYIGILTFYTLASVILQHTGPKFDAVTASMYVAIPNFLAIPLSPTFGRIIDKFGRTIFWLALSACMLITAHLAFLGMALDWKVLKDIPPGVTMAWVGIAYSMYASAIWPTLPFIIKSDMIGTAYGAMTSIQNFGLAVFPTVIGIITSQDRFKHSIWEYCIPLLFFIACGGISLGITVFMFFVDKATTGGILSAVGTEKKAYQKNTLNAKPPVTTFLGATMSVNTTTTSINYDEK